MTHRLTTNCAKIYCNRTLILKVIIENVVTCFLIFGDTLYFAPFCTVFDYENTATLKSGSEGTRGHRNWYHSIACLWFPISILQ